MLLVWIALALAALVLRMLALVYIPIEIVPLAFALFGAIEAARGAFRLAALRRRRDPVSAF